MVQKMIAIENHVGLHARPATMISAEAQKFQSNISLRFEQKEANAKSPVMVLTLGVTHGKVIQLCCEGEDEQEALSHLESVFKRIKEF